MLLKVTSVSTLLLTHPIILFNKARTYPSQSSDKLISFAVARATIYLGFIYFFGVLISCKLIVCVGFTF